MNVSSLLRAFERRTRGLGTIARGLVATATLLASAEPAHAACVNGRSKSCTLDGCAGVQICDAGIWGECTPTESCGPPEYAYDPIGYLDAVRLSPDGTTVTVEGWSADQDAFTSPIQVEIIVDDWNYGPVTANLYRPDVTTVYPAAGSYHGYSTTVPAEPWGRHNVCVRAVNIGTGAPKILGCLSYAVEGKATRTWGLSSVNRCVEDPVGAVTNLSDAGQDLGFTASNDDDLEYLPLFWPHWQGVARLAFGDGQHLVVSRSGSRQFSVVRMMD
ncbi:MAG: hypothetical protein QM820_43970 [Minicystis sp.]